eukprot:1161728-Pelagomonas_calceolata.AAC.8
MHPHTHTPTHARTHARSHPHPHPHSPVRHVCIARGPIQLKDTSSRRMPGQLRAALIKAEMPVEEGSHTEWDINTAAHARVGGFVLC